MVVMGWILVADACRLSVTVMFLERWSRSERCLSLRCAAVGRFDDFAL